MIRNLLISFRSWNTKRRLSADPMLRNLDRDIAEARAKHKPVKTLLALRTARLHDLLRRAG
jgi:hypothetical protein